MNYHNFQVVLQEVPGEVSLCFSISGCPLRCEGCHSPFLWKIENGNSLSEERFIQILIQYKRLATCVLFMGGEWYENELIKLLKLANKNAYKTCLYTGEEQVSADILDELTWLKTGAWKQHLGGLNSPETNQKFIDVKTNQILNNLFTKTKTL